MSKYINAGVYIVAILSCAAGTLAMFAAKIAAYGDGTFLFRFRSEMHWFYDSITAFLFSINLVALMSLRRSNTN